MSYIDGSTRGAGKLTPGADEDEPLDPATAETPEDEAAEDDEDQEAGPASERKGTLVEFLESQIDDINLARNLPQSLLDQIGTQVMLEYQIDENSRAEWLDEMQTAVKLALQKAEPKVYPWPNACYSLDTDILTREGWRPVGAVQVGDEVLSRAPDGAAAYFPVSRTFRHRAPEVVSFQGKSIDLLVTPNHRMLVEDRDTGHMSFINAEEFLKNGDRDPRRPGLSRKSIPLTSRSDGERPDMVFGIDARAYVRFLGWFISEGNAVYGRNIYTNKAGAEVDYGLSGGSFSIAQSKQANPEKYKQLLDDIAACGFTYKAYDSRVTVHARSMPALLKAELRSLGRAYDKHVPRHVMRYAPALLEQLLDTLIMGDGHVCRRAGRQQTRSYFTTSAQLADQVQEIAQKIGLRASIGIREMRAGGVVNGRQITGAVDGYDLNIATKPSVQVLKLRRELISYDEDVACVEVEPHHTVYVRRNGKAVWCGNSNIIYPAISKAALQFGTVAYPALIQGKSVVKGVVNGSDQGTPATVDGKPDGQPKVAAGPGGQPQPVWVVAPGEKRARADRIAEHMSWQLLFEMKEWQAQTDQMLHQIPITGGAVRKTYRDDSEARNRSLLVGLENMVWDYNAASFDDAPRHSEILTIYPHELTTFERTGIEEDDPDDAEGMFLHLDYGPGGGGQTEVHRADGETVQQSSADDSAPHIFIEQHRRWDLDEDGYDEPYVVTVHARSSKVVRIVARYDKEGIKASKDGETIIRIAPVEHYTLIPFLPNLKGGSYPMGFGHLLEHLNEGINTTLNQMFDAGHLANSGGGFIGDQLGMASGAVNFSVGKFVRVTTKGQSIRDAVFPIPFPGPSPVLFQLLGVLIEGAKDIAGLQNVLSGDAALANAPPTTVLALIEQGMKLYTAIHKRIYTALGKEFAKLYRLNRLHIADAERYQVGDEWREIHPDDYRLGGGVEPIADPDMITDMQKLGRAQILMGFKDDPLIDQQEIRRRLFTAANMDRIDDLFAKAQPPNPMAQQAAMLEMALKTAELGRVRAAEQKDQTQAFLNLALARAKASAPEMDWIEKNLDLMRLHIEALNTTVKAAAIDHKFHDTGMRATTEQARLEALRDPAGGAEGPDMAAMPGPEAAPAPAAPLAAAAPAPTPSLVASGVPTGPQS